MGNLHSIILLEKTKSCCSSISKSFSYFFSSITDYCYDQHNKWAFNPNYYPIPLQHIKNNTDIQWIYHSTRNILTFCQASSYQYYKLNWLSAQISIRTHEYYEYNIDEFLSDFLIYTTINDDIPNLFYVFMAWCIYNKKWFPSNADVVFHIIDTNGIEKELQAHAHNYAELRQISLF